MIYKNTAKITAKMLATVTNTLDRAQEQIKQKLIEDVAKAMIEPCVKIEVLDYRTFDFKNCNNELLYMKMRGLLEKGEVEITASFDINYQVDKFIVPVDMF